MTIPAISPEDLAKIEAEMGPPPGNPTGQTRTLMALLAAARELHAIRAHVKAELVIEGDYHPGPDFDVVALLKRDLKGWKMLRARLEERSTLDLIALRGLLDWFIGRWPNGKGWRCAGCETEWGDSDPGFLPTKEWHEQDCPTIGLADKIREGATHVTDENVRTHLLDGPSERRNEGRVHTGVSLREKL